MNRADMMAALRRFGWTDLEFSVMDDDDMVAELSNIHGHDEAPSDDTPYGRGSDHCPWCGADWKAPHDRDCPRPEGE